MNKFKYTLFDISLYFLKLGCIGFGGPIALVEKMHKNLVQEKEWITEEEYKEGLVLSQLAPGPLAAQLSIFLGFVNYGVIGATLTGILFILPSFIMVVLIGMIYKDFGGTNYIQAIFYGVGASVIGIILNSAIKLTKKSIGNFTIQSIKLKWLLWLLFFVGLIFTVVVHTELILLFIGGGFVYMLLKTPKKVTINSQSFLLLQMGVLNIETGTLYKMGIFFLKAGAFVVGSGLAIIPFLHNGVVLEHHWITERQFFDAIAVAMITPGPVVITVGFIGYLIAGLNGAIIASLSTFLPCYLLTVVLANSFTKIAKNISVKLFIEGVTAVVIGSIVGAVYILGKQTIIDIPTLLIASITILTLLFLKKIPEPFILLTSSLVGILLKLQL